MVSLGGSGMCIVSLRLFSLALLGMSKGGRPGWRLEEVQLQAPHSCV